MAFSNKALQLIIDFEGINQPGKWPGAQSGITLGYGYDLGYVTVDDLESDWEDCFTDQQFARLTGVVGRRGSEAQALAPSLSDIRCSATDAQRVLLQRTLPAYTDKARRAFPGFDQLPLDAQGALVSLVYNRGTSMKDSPGQDRRREMRTIRDLVPRMDLVGIAAQLRSMKRLWQGQGLDGLIRRREAEAVLVETCIAPPARRGQSRALAGTTRMSRGAAQKPPRKKASVKPPAPKRGSGKKAGTRSAKPRVTSARSRASASRSPRKSARQR